MLLPASGIGDGVSQWGLGVATLWVHSPSGVAPHCSHRGALGPMQSLAKLLGAFAKPVGGKMMKLQRFWWPLPLGPSPHH